MVASTPYFDAQISLCKYLIYGAMVPGTILGFVLPALLHFYVLRDIEVHQRGKDEPYDLRGEGSVTCSDLRGEGGVTCNDHSPHSGNALLQAILRLLRAGVAEVPGPAQFRAILHANAAHACSVHGHLEQVLRLRASGVLRWSAPMYPIRAPISALKAPTMHSGLTPTNVSMPPPGVCTVRVAIAAKAQNLTF